MKTQALCLFLLLAFCASRAFAIADSAKFPFKKGVNLSKLESWTDTSAGYLAQTSTYTGLKAKGFDHVRLPVYLRNYYNSSTQKLKDNMSTIDGILDNCEAAGLYVFLDFHGWSSINTTNGTDKAEFLKIWELVAARYQDRSDYVIYELLNEPHTTEGGNLDAAYLNELQAEVMPLIRHSDTNRLVLLAAAEWNGPWKLSDLVIPANSGRIGVVCHTYAPMAFTHQGATWGGFSTDHVSFTSTDKTSATGTGDLDNAFRWIDDFQEKTGVPVVMNEFGVYQHNQATAAETLDWTTYVARNCESNGIAWSWWEYNSGFGLYNNGQWRAPVMNGLFPAEPAGNTYASSFNAADYAKSMTISFPGYAGSAPLANFPVLVKLSAGIEGFEYSDFQRADGDDLRFTDANGNLIPHEIDTWNPNGVSTVWVKVPSLSSATTITAHYGCALPVAVDSSEVWDDDYVGVWHLGEGGLPLRESSLASTDFTKQNGTGIQYASSGIVGGSVDFGASGNGRMVTAQDCDALDGFTNCTVEAWTYQTSHTTAAILSKRYSSSKNLSYFLYDNGSKTQFNVAESDSTSGNSAQITPTLNQWTHQAYTFSAGTLRGYQDGAKVGSDKALSFSTINASDGYLHLGNFNRSGAWNADSRNFPGKIDEVRISKVARSADWLQATHDTIANADFATYAMLVPEPAPPPVVTDIEGYDWTNRVVTVTGAAAGETLSLTLSSPDAPSGASYTAVADAEGVARFHVETEPGSNYVYAVSQGGEAIASGSFHAGGWNGYGSWFLTSPDGLGGILESNGVWRLPPTQTNTTSLAVSESAAFALSPDARAEGRGRFVRVETEITYPEILDDTPDESEALADTLAAIAATTNAATGGPAVWKAYVAGAWTTLAGDIPPATNVLFSVRLEIDFTLAAPRVRFSVRDDATSEFSVLVDAATGHEWLVPTATGKTDLAEVAADGETEIHGVVGELSNANVASAGGTGYASLQDALANGGEVTLLTNTTWPTNAPAGTVSVNRDGYSILLPSNGVSVAGNSVIVSAGICTLAGVGTLQVNFTDLESIGVATAGRTPAQIAADLLENGANGIPKWESYVLGLDARDVIARPWADIAAGTAANTVAVSLGGVTVNESAGAMVTYKVYEVDDLADFANPNRESESASTAPNAPVSFSTNDSDVKFFRIKVSIAVP